MRRRCAMAVALAMSCGLGLMSEARAGAPPEEFRWTAGAPVVRCTDPHERDWHAIKDPSIVQADGAWHLFATVRGTKRSHATVQLSFTNWGEARAAPWRPLNCSTGYFCAPQVFRFSGDGKWYLICQASSKDWTPEYQVVWATTDRIADPNSWSRLTPLYEKKPANLKGWIDFWVIGDNAKMHLFFTSNDGRMWRSETARAAFPRGWSEPVLALQGDIFEASHTYHIKDWDCFLTIVEAQGGDGGRYYKAYTADRLEGAWKPLAADREKAFASMRNVEQTAGRWTDSISHGELLRAGVDERLEVDGKSLRFLFQGVLDRDRAGKPYGAIPWSLGLAEGR